MSTLLHIKVIGISRHKLSLQFSQIHPDAPLNQSMSGDDLKVTAFVLLVELLGKVNLTNSTIYQHESDIVSMKLPALKVVNQYISAVEITDLFLSDAWKDGSFDDISSAEIRKPEHWAKIPKMTVQLEFTDERYLDGITEGMECETSFDTLILKWWE